MPTSNATLHKLFCLEGLFLDTIVYSEERTLLRVRSPRTHAYCPRCNTTTGRIHRKTSRMVKHMQCDGKLVMLQLTVRDFLCTSCRHVFREGIPGVDRRHTTEHYRRFVVPKVRDRSFRSVAIEHMIGARTLVAATRALNTERGIVWPSGTFALGIDEHSFSGKDFVQTITDVTNHTLLHLLQDTRQTTLRAWIQKIPLVTRANITAVCIDMCQSYRATLGQELPGTPIVIDPFHVIQHLNKELSDLRLIFTRREYPLPKRLLEKNKEDLTIREKEELQTMFKHYPAIGELWRIKEIIRRMYRLKDPREAGVRYRSVLNGLRGDVRHRFARLYRTLKNWETEILNYFTHRITNGYTEGVHTRIKLLKRISYGFRNKTNYIAKMTLAFLPLATLLTMVKTSTCLT